MAMGKKGERQNNSTCIVFLSVCQRFLKEILSVSVKEVRVCQICQHNKKYNRLECYVSMMLAY